MSKVGKMNTKCKDYSLGHQSDMSNYSGIILMYSYLCGAVNSWLVLSTSDRAIWIRVLARRGHCVVFLGKTLNFHSASLHLHHATETGDKLRQLASRPQGFIQAQGGCSFVAFCCKHRLILDCFSNL